MPKAPFIQKEDSQLFDFGDISFDPEFKKPFLPGVIVSELNDEGRGILSNSREMAGIVISGRSGLARSGIHIGVNDFEMKTGNKVQFDTTIYSLAKDPFRFLQAIREIGANTRIDMGRLLLTNEAINLNKEEVEAALGKGEVGVKHPNRTKIFRDGTLSLPLEDEEWITSEILLGIQKKINNIITSGKHALEPIQGMVPRTSKELKSKHFFVGSIKISVGPYVAIIEPDLNKDVMHIASLILDAQRTTGIENPRQVELFNHSENPVTMKDLSVKIKLYPSPDEASNLLTRNLYNKGKNEKIIEDGVSIVDATNIQEKKVYEALFDNVQENAGNGFYQGRILTPSGVYDVPNDKIVDLNDTILLEASKLRLKSTKQEEVPPYIKNFQNRLALTGGTQSLRKILVTENFPIPSTLKSLMNNGIGGFLAKGIQLENPEDEEINKYYFDSTAYAIYSLLEKKGANLFQIYNNGEENEHLRQFYHGFWTKPEDMEKCDNIDTIVAMYGSHVAGLEDIYREDVAQYIAELKNILGDNTSVVHGGGPGFMLLAHEAAIALDMVSIGIGISVEKIGQKQNLNTTMNANFLLNSRHTRQRLIEIINFIRTFNIGGAGTLEEVAIGLVETKIQNSMAAPFIFVDPTGELGPNKGNLWKPLVDTIQSLAEEKKILINEAEQSINLLSGWASKYLYVVDSYKEAAEIVRQFHSDPMAAWKDWGIPMSKENPVLQNMYHAKKLQMEEIGFKIPKFIEDAIKPIL